MASRAGRNVLSRPVAARALHVELHPPAGLLDGAFAVALRAGAGLSMKPWPWQVAQASRRAMLSFITPPRIAVQNGTLTWYSRSLPGSGPSSPPRCHRDPRRRFRRRYRGSRRRPELSFRPRALPSNSRKNQSRQNQSARRPRPRTLRRQVVHPEILPGSRRCSIRRPAAHKPRPSPDRCCRSKTRAGRRSCASSDRSGRRWLRRSLNFSSAALSPGLTSGWYLRASLRNAFRMSSVEADFFTPSAA